MLMILFALVLIFYSFYVYLTWNFDYWRKRGIYGPQPLPFFGNYPKSAVLLKNIMYEQEELYQQYSGQHRFIGVFERRSPKLLILDPKLVNDVYVKFFKNFHINDSSNSFDEKLDPIFCRNIFAAKGDVWKITRSEMSPAFTPSKLRPMFPIISNSSRKMIGYIEHGSHNVINAKDLSSRFTADIVINCIYGLECDAFEQNSATHKNLVQWFKSSLAKNIVNAVLSTFPLFGCIYKPSFFPQELTNLFYDIMSVAIEHRQRNYSLGREDFLDFLLKCKALKQFSDDDMAAKGAMIFFDAFETTSLILAQTLYHIADSEKCQEKLRSEINNHYDHITADNLNEMHYLEYVLNETLRISPSAFLLTKNCTDSIDLIDYDGKKLLIEKGTPVQLPIYAIHHDANIYAKPSVFDPERFADISVNELKNDGVFLPFGAGPRICLGQRFAILQIKVAIIELIRHYTVSVSSETTTPIMASSLESLMIPISEIYLSFQKIS